MTKQKPFKSRVRARMSKTGERYTAARRHLLTTPEQSEPDTSTPAAAPEGSVRRATGRMSDETVRSRTGRGWDEWFALLDSWGARSRTHTEIARWLVGEHDVAGWWAQSVTVAYEQERGMRAPAQHADGFTAGASKTINVPAERLSAAFTDPQLRERWLPGATLDVRTNRPGKSLTADWDGGTSRLAVYLTTKGETKSQVAVQHQRLPDADAAEQRKAYWRDALTALKSLLEHDPNG
jgi:uncharacterized protein YndB with AHSA1/START domain